jgi:hypothetical protein
LLGSPQVLRTPSILIEYRSFQRHCTGLSKHRGHGMLGLKLFFLEHGYVMGSVNKTLFSLNHCNDFYLFSFMWMILSLVALLMCLCLAFRK